MSQRISFKVHGEVQGVFFRKFTQQKASAYSITGFVRNEPDGTVAGEAQGAADDLDALVRDLHKGPRHARVSRVEKKEVGTKSGEEGFRTDG